MAVEKKGIDAGSVSWYDAFAALRAFCRPYRRHFIVQLSTPPRADSKYLFYVHVESWCIDGTTNKQTSYRGRGSYYPDGRSTSLPAMVLRLGYELDKLLAEEESAAKRQTSF